MTDPLARLNAALSGRYRVDREIGSGGMATVYLAEDLKHHRQVAVKVLRPDLAANLGAERFLREIEIAAKLQHPHILPLYDSGGSGDVLYYVMPLVEGQSLRDKIAKSGALPIDEGVRIIRDVAGALAYSHQHGVVHRDIKPENVLLSSGHALVTDFGVAKAVSDAASASELTGTGVTLGTPAYMAPEQATADASLDHRADIYALGVMSYEILAGRAPFTGNPQQVIAAHLTRPPEALSLNRPAVPPALEAVVMRCLQKNPADRFQSADEILRALDAMAATSGTATGAATAGSAQRRRRWRGAAVGAVAAVVVIAAGVTWFARVGRAGTLIGDKVLAENDLVLVSEFENHTADSSLSGTVTDAVRMDLQESRAVRVMSQSAMWGGLERMGLGHGTVLPQPKVQDLAEREGAKAFVVGNIARVGASFQITARVIATNGGSEALVAHATARDSTALIGAVQDVGRTLRRGIGESLRSVMTAPALAQVTTASLPALRAYSASRRAEVEGQRPRAVVLSKEAIALDSGFASAWSGLAVTYTNMGLVRPATDAVARAYALRGHLSELERLRIEAFYHATHGEMVETEAAWQRLAELGRDETNYADMLLSMGRLREAEEMGHRAVVSESKRSIAYWNLAEAQVGLHHFAGAESTAALIAKNLPENPYRYFIASGIRWGRRDFDAVESFLASPDAAKIPFAGELRCQAHLYRGQVRAWQNCPAPPGGPDRVLTIAAFRLTGDTVRARAGYAPFLAAAQDKRDPDEYPGVIVLLADVGKVREAHQLLDEWRTRSGPTDPEFRADSAAAVGAIAAAERQWDRATAAFLAWNTSPMASARHVYNRGLPEAAAILARRGQADSAIVLFERALATSSLFGGNTYEATWYTQALSTLGDLYEARGDHAKAADNYRRYVDMMKDADPAFAGQVAAVKEKLARVTLEPGGRSKAP
jgi:tRNA A-37 threonylcarbamoyl transferase component Bud32/tetratricopeptide (TPR) repeat protein/TolB-like protein